MSKEEIYTTSRRICFLSIVLFLILVVGLKWIDNYFYDMAVGTVFITMWISGITCEIYNG